MTKKVYIFFAEGFEEIEALAPVDILKRAGLDVTLVSITGNQIVKSTRGVGIVTDVLIEQTNCNDADLLVLPGGQPGANNLDKHEGLRKIVLDANNKKTYIAAICAAPLVLGHLGLLDGKKATCYPGTEPELKGAVTTGSALEISQNIITSKGAGTAIKFSLALVELLVSKQKALDLKAKMMID